MAEPVELNWPGGEHEFMLRLGELEALDDKTKDGVLDLRYRLSLGQARGSMAFAPVRISEVLDCLRLGLIGAGMPREDANKKVKSAFEDGDMSELALTAYLVISNAVSGKDHDPLGEGEAGEAETESASDSPASMETAP